MLGPLPKYPYDFVLHLLNSSALLDIPHWQMSFSHADVSNIPHQQLCGLNPLFNTTFSGMTWLSLCLFSLITAIDLLFLQSGSRQACSGYFHLDRGTLVTLAGVCNDNVGASSLLYLERFQPQSDRVERGDLEAEAFRAAVCFSNTPVLLCSVWFLRRQFSPEPVEVNSGKWDLFLETCL